MNPLYPLAGGALIGLSASVLLLSIGRVAGISGILGHVLRPGAADRLWRFMFLAGLLAGGAILGRWVPEAFVDRTAIPTPFVMAGGLLVGLGTQMGGGCTSGHGVCGVSRLSGRSVIATATFMLTGLVTVFVTRHLLGGL